MLSYRKTRLLLSGAALFSLTGSAFALDGNDVLAKLNAAYANQGGNISADSVTTNGDTIELKGAKFTATANKTSIPLGNIAMSDVEENNGGYIVGTVKFDDVNISKDGMKFTAKDLYMTDVNIPADPNAGTIDSFILAKNAHSGEVIVSQGDAAIVTMNEANIDTTIRDNKSGYDVNGKVDGIKISIPESAANEAVKKLELQNIEGNISLTGGWELSSGRLNLIEIFDFDNVGKLSVSFDLSGYTLAFIKSMQEAAKNAQASATNPEQAQQAAGMAMIGLMQQLTFNSAEIKFEDDSITERGLAYAGEKQGGKSGKEVADSLKAMVPMMLAQLNAPEFQKAVSDAVNTYLDDPESFTITMKPAQPVAFPSIAGAAMAAPNTLPTVLGVTVKAND